ncbi:MAG: hypothetical protein MK078_04205 [Crocinitomicaceae bacterium]|nr:hypothetical protein [Crocinitomicaceae bacterium]
MLNKQHLTYLTVLIFLGSISFGQKGTKNPYSVLGIGELQMDNYAAYAGLGNVSLGATDSTIINYNNPASYSSLARYLPVMQVGFNGKFSNFSTETNTSNEQYFGLNQFQLGLPIANKWGAAIGLKPYSFRGYTVGNYTVVDSDTTAQSINEGSGAISKVFLGIGYRPITSISKDTVIRQRRDTTIIDTFVVSKAHRIALGANFNYFFGTVKQSRSFENFPIGYSLSDPYNSRVENSLRMSDIGYEFGINYSFTKITPRISEDQEGKSTTFAVGATYTPGLNIRGFQDLISYSYQGSFYEGALIQIKDTVQSITNNVGTLYLPEEYKFGIEYRKNPTYGNESQLRIGADVNYQAWSKYTETFETSGPFTQLNDRLFAGIGLEYTPDAIYGKEDDFLSRIRYRIGFNYTMLEYSILNNMDTYQQISNYGMSFGFGIPLTGSKGSNTNINLGFNLGSLGTQENGLIREQYAGVFLGFSMTPGYDNAWFRKRLFN